MGEKTPTLTENMNLASEKQRTPDELAAKMTNITRALIRRAQRSEVAIVAGNTEGNTMEVNNTNVIHSRVAETGQGVTTYAHEATRPFTDEKVMMLSKTARGDKDHGDSGAVMVSSTENIPGSEPVRGSGLTHDMLHSEGSTEGYKMSPDEVQESAVTIARQLRQEIVDREKAHASEIQKQNNESRSSVLAA